MGTINIPTLRTWKLNSEALSNPPKGPQLEMAELGQNLTPWIWVTSCKH